MLELAVNSDREAVNALALQVHAMHVAWAPGNFEMTEQLYPQERFHKAVQARELYVAKVGGVAVGYALLKVCCHNAPGLVKRKLMQVEELCVDEDLRGQGIGTAMMEDIHALARAFGCAGLQLGVYPQNESAVAFYQKCGFTMQNIKLSSKV